jgi:ribosomal protein L25 (general stress protein Ctc)
MKKIINWIKRIFKPVVTKVDSEKIKINDYLDIILYPKQQEIINTINNSKNSFIVRAPRQSGKSTILQVSAIDNLLNSKVKVGLSGFTYHNEEYNFQKIKDFLEKKFKHRIIKQHISTIWLDNGSILTTSINNKDYFDIIYYDEFAFYGQENVERYFYGVNAGKQILISTKKEGSCFNTIWCVAKELKSRFIFMEIKFDDVPWFTLEVERELIGRLGCKKYEAEYT